MKSVLLESTGTVLAYKKCGGHRLVIRISIFLVSSILLWGSPLWAASFDPYFDLSLLGDFYPTKTSSEFNNGQLHGRFKLLSQKEFSKTYLDLGAGLLVGEKAENYFILPQAYFTYQKNDQFNVTFGRTVKNFSQLDTYWMMGDILPLFRWDAARPEAQGLAGLFMTYKPSQNVQFDLFGSYLFLPTQGPSFSIIDGKLTSGNPWFSSPVDALLVSGTTFDLNYSVNTPNISDIIFKPAVGLSVLFQTDDETLWMRSGYFLKQRNDLITPFEGTITTPPAQVGDVDVYPVVANHKITTLDIGAKGETWNFTLSGLYESDVRFDKQPTWIYPQYSDQYKVSFNALFKINSFQSFEMGGLRTFNNQVTVQGFGSATVDVFSFRNQYDNAVDLRLTSVFFPRQQGFLIKTKARVAYDYKAETTMASLEAIYSPRVDISGFVRADFFGGRRPAAESYNNLLTNYLNKDRIQTGVKYVF